MHEERHKIRKGDWIIRNPEDPPEYHTEESAKAAYVSKMLLGLDKYDYSSYSDHAIYVVDATQSHLTVFNPLNGDIRILLYDAYPGTWHYATEEQYKATWQLASSLRNQANVISLEQKNYPYRPITER